MDETQSLWPAHLSEVTLAVPDPPAAVPYYAALLDAIPSQSATGVEFADGTRLRLVEGRPGFVLATLDVAAAIQAGTVEDHEGRSFELTRRKEVETSPLKHGPSLGHLTFTSTDPLAAQAFYEELGFRLSEALADDFRWLRCNPAHHTLAFSRAGAQGLHHVGLDYPNRDSLLSACDRLAALDQRLEYGPGRHMVGGNMFVYFRDRYGIRFELLCELRIVERGEPPLIHRDVPRERSVNVWGPLPPPSFREAL